MRTSRPATHADTNARRAALDVSNGKIRRTIAVSSIGAYGYPKGDGLRGVGRDGGCGGAIGGGGRRKSGTRVAAVVSPVGGTANTKWVLNPNRPLRAGTTYVAKVGTGVVDKVGHHLDQRPALSGNQPKEWTFKTRR